MVTGKYQQWNSEDVTCPQGCEAAIVLREEEDEVFYKDKDSDGINWINYSVKVRIPVFYCEQCDQGWTDYRAEDICTAAITAERIRHEIHKKIKLSAGVDK